MKRVGLMIILALICEIVFTSCGSDNLPNKKDLINNYEAREREILELKSFFNSIVPDDYSVYIEFKGSKKVDLWVFEAVDNFFRGRVPLFQQWNINPYNYQEETPITYDSTEYYIPRTKSLTLVKQKLRWNDDTFRKIKEMLDRANCISISSGEPATIGFARRVMGKYSYVLHENIISDFLKSKYKESCSYILYNDKVVLEFGGGAFTSDCFPSIDLIDENGTLTDQQAVELDDRKDKNGVAIDTTKPNQSEEVETPLVIVDGKESNMQSVSTENIESFTVIKGKQAIKLYGEHGKNGVVIITTKKQQCR